MEHRRLGNSGLRVPALSFGTATFGGSNSGCLPGMAPARISRAERTRMTTPSVSEAAVCPLVPGL
jgi:aryl-alcohol dehydrogenase-like predicted oxidoreductase